MARSDLEPWVRRQWVLRGQVQGVGFRPFVHRLAAELGLSGSVRNDAAGVTIEAQGPAEAVERFGRGLEEQAPPLAAIHTMRCRDLPTVAGERGFVIVDSAAGDRPSAAVTVDTAVCADCRREMLDPANRRRRYALVTCTNCGPRFSIIRRVPYDRPNTTMAGFAMCQACRREYDRPADRRFHAQPIACHDCGPRLGLVDAGGAALPGEPIAAAAEMLRQGRIVAIKGLGGFHLAVRADDPAAVARLRKLKHRDAKPFALMCPDLAAAGKLVKLSAAAATALLGPACPIVLAPRAAGGDAASATAAIAPGVAPDSHRLGVMLAYTPVHHLLFDAGGPLFPAALVMTSGNQSDEPLAIDNAEAVERLGGLCDAFLWHDRPIERRVDDSVLLDMGPGQLPLPLRRSRGYAPGELPLPGGATAQAGLCVGGELKNTVAVVRDGAAILSQHLGDLTHPLALDCFRKAIDDLCELFGVRPRWIAHDLHPLYLSTRYAGELARRWGARLVGVQHHHAHAAAVLAEHGHTEPALAVVCDGVGYGDDGSIWGGELLHLHAGRFTRLAHLRPLRLPGGDAAARDLRRCGLALLHQALGDDFAEHPAALRLAPEPADRNMLAAMIRRRISCTESTAAGRVFDGVAALLDLARHNQFEAQAPMRLEAAAERCAAVPDRGPLFSLSAERPAVVDLSPLVRALLADLARGTAAEDLAAVFHEQLAWAWSAAADRFAAATGARVVALSGGVFCNQRLTAALTRRLSAAGLAVLRHEKVPANDGGLALGQAAVAAARGRS